MKACEDREVWFEAPHRVLSAIERRLKSMECSVSIKMDGEDAAVLTAECGSCRLRVTARRVGPIPETLGTPARLARESGLGRVFTEFKVEGDCVETCRVVELALFRAGG